MRRRDWLMSITLQYNKNVQKCFVIQKILIEIVHNYGVQKPIHR